MTQQFHSSGCTPKNWKQVFKQIRDHMCSQQNDSQLLKGRNGPNTHPWMMDKQCGPSTHGNITQLWKGVKHGHLLQRGWILRTRCSVREARHRRTHSVWFHWWEMSRTGRCADTEWIRSCQGLGEWLLMGMGFLFWNLIVELVARLWIC